MIKFGTGGWRAIIADDFTKANIRLLTAGLCELMLKEGHAGPRYASAMTGASSPRNPRTGRRKSSRATGSGCIWSTALRPRRL